MKTLLVKTADPRKAFWQRHEAHPDGEVFVHGPHAAEVAETAAVRRALKEGRLVEATEEEMPQVYNWKGERYTAETLATAPAEFLVHLAERGLLPAVELGTVDEVLADVKAGNLSPAVALAAERAGKGRVTLIAALEAQLAGGVEEEE